MAIGIPDVSLQDNTEERTPLVLVLDCSGSMDEKSGNMDEKSGNMDETRISALNKGLQTLEVEMKKDPTTSTRGRVMVIEFGDDDEIKQGLWQDVIDFKAPTLIAGGSTPTGAAITSALAAIEAQKAELKANGVPYKRPILMLMSDGEPTDHWESAADACKAAEAANKVTVFAIGIGDDADLNKLGNFSRNGARLLKGTQFKELFVWLSASVKAVSKTAKGESAQLPPTDSWAATGPV